MSRHEATQSWWFTCTNYCNWTLMYVCVLVRVCFCSFCVQLKAGKRRRWISSVKQLSAPVPRVKVSWLWVCGNDDSEVSKTSERERVILELELRLVNKVCVRKWILWGCQQKRNSKHSWIPIWPHTRLMLHLCCNWAPKLSISFWLVMCTAYKGH